MITLKTKTVGMEVLLQGGKKLGECDLGMNCWNQVHSNN